MRLASRWSLVAGLVFLISLFGFAQEKPVALKGGKLLTVTHGVIENGVLLIEDGKIAAVGAAASVKIPKDARVIDVTGMTVYPGLIDSETHLGLIEISAENMTNDMVESSDEITPQMHVYDAFHAESELIPVTRLNGITNVIVAPDNADTLPGQDSFVQLNGTSATEMLLIRDIAMPRTIPPWVQPSIRGRTTTRVRCCSTTTRVGCGCASPTGCAVRSPLVPD